MLSERLQELYSETNIMDSENCKFSQGDLKREFFFFYYGLRAEHNELVHIVKDVESALLRRLRWQRAIKDDLSKARCKIEAILSNLGWFWATEGVLRRHKVIFIQGAVSKLHCSMYSWMNYLLTKAKRNMPESYVWTYNFI